MPNMTGGFSDESCHSCHFGNPVNASGGDLRLEGVPPSFIPARVYTLTVHLSRQSLKTGGFQLAARFASGARKGRQAGDWGVLDQHTQIIPSSNDSSLRFVQHTRAGTQAPEGAAPGELAWTVEWTAPGSAAADIDFHLAANASNDDESAFGDFIYMVSVRSVAAR